MAFDEKHPRRQLGHPPFETAKGGCPAERESFGLAQHLKYLCGLWVAQRLQRCDKVSEVERL